MSQLVKDFQGNMIPKIGARKIKNENGKFEYFQENISCIKMPDSKWYRTTTGKILYDHSLKAWIFTDSFKGSKGLVEDGSFGCYSDRSKEVPIRFKRETFSRKTLFDPMSRNLEHLEFKDTRWNNAMAMTEEVAIKHGFEEFIRDATFYKASDVSPAERDVFNQPHIPASERTNTYSLDDDKEYRTILEECYEGNNISIPINLKRFARKYIPYSFGIEWEVQNGHMPKRIREPLGVRTCRDGSLGDGLEYVSIPMQGGKGLAIAKKVCDELTKRCVISGRCSVHVHFGGVRKDKLYILSLWTVLTKIQDEFRKYFPFSRTNPMSEGAKIYASLLPDLGIDVSSLLGIKTDGEFRNKLMKEFNKIYSWLNNGHPLGEKFDEEFVKETKQEIINGRTQDFYCYRVKKYSFTTKLPRHAVQGRKWERATRYMFCNFLNLFFSHSRTVEFRIHEATTNFDKILAYMAICIAILKYAEDFTSSLSKGLLSIQQILESYYESNVSTAIMDYLNKRRTIFCTNAGEFRKNHPPIESSWLNSDKGFEGPKIYE